MLRPYYLFFLIAIVILTSCKGIKRTPSDTQIIELSNIAIIPQPTVFNMGNQNYLLPAVNIICFNAEAEEGAEWLSHLLKSVNINTARTSGSDCGNWNLEVNDSLKGEFGDEGYSLEIKAEGVFIKAATNAGIFYATQTLRQILPVEIETNSFNKNNIQLPNLFIKDIPRYEWRGTMVDISRSFFDLEYLKSHVDRMALYKMNRLHLHLTDDQGWRIEIKGKPGLTNIGSKGSVLNGRPGYLTQEEYIDLQTYAAARNIIIIPEIDMPGHIYSALVAYPELNCDEFSNIEPRMATPPELFSGTKVGWSKLCLTKPEIYDFVSDVIGEMASITTGPWIHIGGDEIKDDLYETFVVKADSIVQQHGKITIGWEEVTKAPVSSSLISQQWHGKVESVVDVQVIESICTSFYFDHANIPGQEKTNNWCKKSGVSLEEVYNFTSVNPNVIGFEAPVWTEFVWTDEEMDNRFWPRTIAVAEIAWNTDTSKNYGEFISRLKKHTARLRAMGVNYFLTEELGEELGEEVNGNKRRSDVFKDFLPESL
ncbi:hypothetical protein BH23BAC2_BH23BAC2_03130 [soil metagenome]